MALTNLAAFSAALSGLTVPEVTRKLSQAPTVVNTADLPLMYPRLPKQTVQTVTLSGANGLRSVTLELVIIIEPLRQDLQAANYAKVLSLADALYTVITGNALALGLDEFTTEMQVDAIGQTPYWMLVTTVSAS